MNGEQIQLCKDVNFLLDVFARRCETVLLRCPEEFKFPPKIDVNNWSAYESKIRCINKNFLERLHCNGNVYAIHSRSQNCDPWNLMYVGKSLSNILSSRIISHFVKKSDKTRSKLEEVQDKIAKGYKVGVSYIKIEPENLRGIVENRIIQSKKPPWNKQIE